MTNKSRSLVFSVEKSETVNLKILYCIIYFYVTKLEKRRRKAAAAVVRSSGSTCARLAESSCGQRWASTLSSWSNAQHRSKTRPSFQRGERSYFFEKAKAKIVPSTTIVGISFAN
jgi:hypothetical protein